MITGAIYSLKMSTGRGGPKKGSVGALAPTQIAALLWNLYIFVWKSLKSFKFDKEKLPLKCLSPLKFSSRSATAHMYSNLLLYLHISYNPQDQNFGYTKQRMW
jgi:hypothetical protein